MFLCHQTFPSKGAMIDACTQQLALVQARHVAPVVCCMVVWRWRMLHRTQPLPLAQRRRRKCMDGGAICGRIRCTVACWRLRGRVCASGGYCNPAVGTWPHRRPLSIVAHADHNDRRTKHRVSLAASAALRTIRCGRRDGLCNPYLLLGCRQSWASYRASSSWAPGGAAAVPRRSAVGCRGSLSPAGTWRRLPAG